MLAWNPDNDQQARVWLQASDDIPRAALEQLRQPLQQTREFAQTEITSLAEGMKDELTGAESRMTRLEVAVQSLSADLTQFAEGAEAALSEPYSDLAERLSQAEARADEREQEAAAFKAAAESRTAAADERIERLEGVVAALQGLLEADSRSRCSAAACNLDKDHSLITALWERR